MKRAPLYLALTCLCISVTAAAETRGVPANPSSDYKSNELKLEVTPGKIDTKDGKAEVKANALTTSKGDQGGNGADVGNEVHWRSSLR